MLCKHSPKSLYGNIFLLGKHIKNSLKIHHWNINVLFTGVSAMLPTDEAQDASVLELEENKSLQLPFEEAIWDEMKEKDEQKC